MSLVWGNIAAILIGLSGGLAVGGGMVSFLIVLDIVPRLAQMTRTFDRVHVFEAAMVAGVLFWTFADFFDWGIRGAPILASIFGLLAGCFIGMLAGALTEVLNVLPIMAKRLGLGGYIVWLLMAMVLGKVAGSLFEWIVFRI
ncbi:stage V sporulation protein AB [Paenibacillus mesophilus]|uniref:stage V sporulation protein AB n=1 Tax=Paenibacillus mesophilus TaxID=2582849 RepID=UPI00110EBBF1|nr:stage V sporulation protein AB [Paenibacillus mesophilus]TMV51352.1 stage V sporulation protein AB [Paenibacillus mesophilus]